MAGNILIITFFYPPYPKVGSRRWVKFAKYLHRSGKSIRLLVAQMDVDKKSPWDEDAQEVEKFVTRLHFKYPLPYYKKTIPVSLMDKFRWHASKILSSGKNRNNTTYDNSEIYAPEFLKAARKIIQQENITTVVFTATPFHLAWHLSQLKKEFSNVKFVFDLRDLWTDWMKDFPAEKFQYELQLERETIKNSDLVITPAEKIGEILKARYPGRSDTIKVIPHAFDADDFKSAENNAAGFTRKGVHLVYAGTMYSHMEENMHVLAELLKANNNLYLDLFTFNTDYSEIFKDFIAQKRVKYHQPLSIKSFTGIVNKYADALLYMRSSQSNDTDFLSSKFFDYLLLRKPLVYIGGEGKVDKFIHQNKIGFSLTKDNLADFEKNLSEAKKAVQDFDIQPYSFESVSQYLLKTIEN